MTSRYILGAGLSALCYGWYNREYTLIGLEIGGRMNKKFFENIIYFHDSLQTRTFLTEVGITFNKRTQVIKYLKDGKLTQSITQEDKINMIKKKMNDETFVVHDNTLSTSDYYISILEFSFQELIDKIKDKVKIINEKIIRITDKQIITENTAYDYIHIVNTLPADVFNSLYYKQRDLKFDKKSVTFVLSSIAPKELENKTFDMVYIIDKDKQYSRISKKPGERGESLLLYEFTGSISKEDVQKLLPENADVLEHYIDDTGIIFTNYNNFEPKNILNIGRFARWQHQDKQQDVLKAATFNFDVRNIWARQGYFSSSARIDFNLLENNIEEKEKETQLLILHLYAEISEILSEINYKKHRQRKEVNIEKVHEEIIDAWKYLLNICLVWNMTPEIFLEVFNKKSDLVEERFAKEFKK